MGEHAALGGLFDEFGVAGVDQDDYGTGGLSDDPVDQFQGVLRALAEPDECDVGSLPGRDGGYVVDLDLAGDHFVSERDHGRGDERETVLALVGDQARRCSVSRWLMSDRPQPSLARDGVVDRVCRGFCRGCMVGVRFASCPRRAVVLRLETSAGVFVRVRPERSGTRLVLRSLRARFTELSISPRAGWDGVSLVRWPGVYSGLVRALAVCRRAHELHDSRDRAATKLPSARTSCESLMRSVDTPAPQR